MSLLSRKYPWYVAARAQTMAELLLEKIFPQQRLVAQDPSFPYDFLLSLKARAADRFVGVEIRAVERDPAERYTFQVRPQALQRLQSADVQILILILNVKENHSFYAWADEIQPRGHGIAGTVYCSVPVGRLTEDQYAIIRNRVGL
jgi:hypothetical protein